MMAEKNSLFPNGTYQLSFYEENSSDSSFAMNTASIISENFSCSFKYAGDNRYTIRKAGEEKYLKADTLSNTPSSNELWGSKQEAGTFLITRKKDYYTICDETTKRNLSQNDGSILEFTTDSNAVWRLTRNKKQSKKKIFRFLSSLTLSGQSIITAMKPQKILTQIIFALPAAVFLPQ